MAKVHGVAGEWARIRGAVIGLWPLAVGIFAGGFSVATWMFFSAAVGASAFALSLAGMGLAYARGLKHVESFYKGAIGEEMVSRILSRLGDGYHVFNDFEAKGSHVDHVVIGPAGFYAIETKMWRGTVTIDDGHVLVDGKLPSRDPVAQACREAALVKGALKELGCDEAVTPVVVFASDTFAHHVAEVNGTVVMNASEVINAFSTKRVVVQADVIDRMVTLMENRK